jgi:hypothetical protein
MVRPPNPFKEMMLEIGLEIERSTNTKLIQWAWTIRSNAIRDGDTYSDHPTYQLIQSEMQRRNMKGFA